MKIIAYLDQNEKPKLTSYKIVINEYPIMLDFGNQNVLDLTDIKYIFLTHEHLDHFNGLVENILLLNQDVLIFSTNTTKQLIISIIERYMQNGKYSHLNAFKIKKAFEKIISLYFYEPYQLDGFMVTLYPSGHTFGSSMIYLECEEGNLLYTGDMDYQAKNPLRQYQFPTEKTVDYLIVDGTTFIKDDIKKQGISKIRNYDMNTIKINARPEKAIYVAHAFMNITKYNDYTIIIRKDLVWYLQILHEQGYPVFIHKRIVLETQKQGIQDIKGKKIIISNEKYDDYNKDYLLSLHISNNDLVKFIHKLSNPKVYLGHYEMDKQKDLVNLANEFSFNVLKEGENL